MADGLFSASQRRLTFSTMAVIATAAYNNLSVNAALPAIGDDLGHLAWLPWVVTIELVASAIAVLAIGPVIDAIGTRTSFRVVLVGFVIASVFCALAPSMAVLIIARAFQGLAVGAIIAIIMAAIGLGVPAALRARAYAANSSVWGVMGLAGPAVAAVLLDLFGWPAIFLVNVPVALVGAAVGWHAFPGPTDQPGSLRPDRRGFALLTAFTLVSLAVVSWIAWWTPLLLLAGLALVGLYASHERRTIDPVLRVRHLTAPQYRWLHVTALLVLSGGIAANAFLPVYAKGVRGYAQDEAAFTVVFMTVGWTVGAFVASRIAERARNESAVLIFSIVLAVSTGSIAAGVGFDWAMPALFVAYLFSGVGLGGVASTGLAALQACTPPPEMGRVNAAHQFVRTLGFSYGAAIGGAILFSVVALELGDADAVRSLLDDDGGVPGADLVDALRLGYLWSMVAATAISALSVVAAVMLHRSAVPVDQPAPLGAELR